MLVLKDHSDFDTMVRINPELGRSCGTKAYLLSLLQRNDSAIPTGAYPKPQIRQVTLFSQYDYDPATLPQSEFRPRTFARLGVDVSLSTIYRNLVERSQALFMEISKMADLEEKRRAQPRWWEFERLLGKDVEKSRNAAATLKDLEVPRNYYERIMEGATDVPGDNTSWLKKLKSTSSYEALDSGF
jgi:hypothetical protein